MRPAAFALTVVTLTLFATLALAKGKEVKTRPSSSSIPQLIQVSVTYGEKTTEFLVETKDGTSYVTLTAGQEKVRGRELKLEDAQYLASKLQTISPKLEASARCSRKWAYASMISNGKKNYEASACLGDDTAVAKTLLGVANLLSAAN